eukprot:255491-Rhodomonas_salina.1
MLPDTKQRKTSTGLDKQTHRLCNRRQTARARALRKSVAAWTCGSVDDEVGDEVGVDDEVGTCGSVDDEVGERLVGQKLAGER